MRERLFNIIAVIVIVVIGSSSYYFNCRSKYKIEQACIENYKVIIKKDGTPHQLVDKFGRGIVCDDWETNK